MSVANTGGWIGPAPTSDPSLQRLGKLRAFIHSFPRQLAGNSVIQSGVIGWVWNSLYFILKKEMDSLACSHFCLAVNTGVIAGTAAAVLSLLGEAKRSSQCGGTESALASVSFQAL